MKEHYRLARNNTTLHDHVLLGIFSAVNPRPFFCFISTGFGGNVILRQIKTRWSLLTGSLAIVDDLFYTGSLIKSGHWKQDALKINVAKWILVNQSVNI